MKLRVENLAKIEKAEVDVKDLTLFVGQNSTHKSYMAHVIYELLTILNSNSEELKKEKRNILFSQFQKSEFLLKHIMSKEKVKKTNNQYLQIIFSFEQDRKEFDDLIKRLFNLSNVVIKKLINKSFNNQNELIKNISYDETLNINDLFLDNEYKTEIYEEEEDTKDDIIVYLFINDLLEKIFTFYKNLLSKYHQIQYFPASRTGFVLAFDEIVSGLLRDKYKGQSSSARLTKPTIDFITNYSDIRTNKMSRGILSLAFDLGSKDNDNEKSKSKLINFLQKNIIKGTIEEEKLEDNYKNFYLKTENQIKLDLHLASSATLETLPFVVFLKDNTNIKDTFFVIEEPEAHLHPKAQVQMAKFIVLLVNTGAKVLVTTHSDYILNEINNCIKLFSIKREDEFAISKDSVSSYLFKNEKDKTTVNRLEIDKFGISNDNFDEVLDELLDKSNELSEKILDNE